MNGEYILSKDPDNVNTLEEYIARYCPELLEEEIRSFEDDEDTTKEDVY